MGEGKRLSVVRGSGHFKPIFPHRHISNNMIKNKPEILPFDSEEITTDKYEARLGLTAVILFSIGLMFVLAVILK